MSQTVVVDGEITLTSMMDGDLGVALGIDGYEHESGEWTTSENVSAVNISFNRQHQNAPVFAIIVDATNSLNTEPEPYSTVQAWVFTDIYNMTGAKLYLSQSNISTGTITRVYKYATGGSYVNATTVSGETHEEATSTGLHIVTNSSFVPNRLYKWLAIWKA